MVGFHIETAIKLIKGLSSNHNECRGTLSGCDAGVDRRPIWHLAGAVGKGCWRRFLGTLPNLPAI